MKRRQLISKIALLSILTPLFFSPKSVEAVTISEGKSMIERAVRRYADHYEYDGYAYMFSYMSEYRAYGHAWTGTYYESSTENRWLDPYPFDIGGNLYNPDPTMNAQGKRLIGYESNFGFRCMRNAWSNDSEYKGLHDNHGSRPNTHVDYERLFKATYKRAKTYPQHNGIEINGGQYIVGNDYWVRPNTQLNIKVGGYQNYPGDGGLVLDDYINRNYLRLDGGSGNDARICYNFSAGAQDNFQPNDGVPMSYVPNSAWTSSNGKTKTASFYATPKKDAVDYRVKTYFSSANGKTTDDYYDTGKYIKVDGKAPTVDATPTIVDGDMNTATITFHNAGDVRGEGSGTRAGVGMATNDDIDQSLKIYKPGQEDKAVYLYVTQRTETSVDSNGVQRYDLKWIINYDDAKLSSLNLKEYYGELKFKIHLEDWLSNTYESGEYSFHRADPTPSSTEVELLNWDYAEPNTNNKWVKTEKDVNIRTKVKNNEIFDSLLNLPPTGTKLYLTGDNGFWDDVRVSGIVEKSNTAEGIYNSKNYKGTATKESGINTLSAEHTIKGRAINNGKKYSLSTSGYVVYNGTKFETAINNKEVNNNILAFDGQAPLLVSGIPGNAWTKDNVQMNISFKDNESGIKRITLYKGSTKIKENVLSTNSKSATANIQYTETSEGIHNYRVEVVDNVGNTSEKTFTIKIDKTAPTITGIPSDAWTNKDITINLSATDALSGMKSLELFDHNNKKVASGVGSLSYKVNTTGKLKFKVIAKDNVGNTSEKYFIIRIDKTAPRVKNQEDVKYKLNSSSYDLNINAEKIIEVESGINEIWGEFYIKGTNDRIKEVFKPSNTMLDIVKDLYNTKKGESKYDEKYDYNTDGIIDIYDIVKAAVKYTNYYPEDYNEDGLVDKKDLDIIRALNNVRYGEPKYHPKYDLNDDNIINSNDFAIVENKIGISSYYELDVNLAEILGTDKNIVVEVWGKDNVNNKRLLSQKEFNTMVTPDNVEVEITKAKYIDGNTYWVNGKDEFNIRTKGVSPDGFTRYPGVNNLFVGGNGIYQESYSGTKIEVTKNSLNMNNGSDNDKYISTYENYFAKEVISNGKYSLQVDHKLLAQDAANGMKFNLYTNAGTDYNNEMHYSKMGTTNQVLAVDTVAPKGTVSINYNNETLDMNVSANVSDNESGLKKVYIKYYPTDDISVAKYKDLDNVDGTYTTSFNTYEEFSSATEVKVEVIAVDNVDNERVLKSQEFDTFFVEAEILRVLSPSYPNFKEGEKGKLVIKVRGGVEKLKITFPYEFTILDNTVNKEITLEPKKEDQVIVEFFIPFEIENKSYQVKVEGYKKNKVKTVYPSFKVLGSITEEFRTRIRYK